ncbi:MAG: signal peptide peptidase SppA [bacterium]
MRTNSFLKFSSIIICYLFSGCAFVNAPINLFSSRQPLVEQKIEGTGTGKILIVDISGDIETLRGHEVMGSRKKPGMVSEIKEVLRKAERDPDIKAVVLRVNSQGGTVTASDIIYHEIKTFKQRKKIPVVAALLDYAASGGYYVAVAADKLVANPTTVLGSIGVLFVKINVKGLMEKIGVDKDVVTGGKMKAASFPFEPFTDEERRLVQDIIDHLHDRFKKIVRENRPGLTSEELDKIADGRVFDAEKAKRYKLVDQIGYLPDAISLARRMAGLSEASIITYKQNTEYKGDIYAGSRFPQTVNLLNFDLGVLAGYGSPAFMYRWVPASGAD